MFQIALWPFFSVVSWRWRDGKNGGLTIASFICQELNQVTLFWYKWKVQTQFKILSLIKKWNKSKSILDKRWIILADFCAFYDWVEDYTSWDQHHFALFSPGLVLFSLNSFLCNLFLTSFHSFLFASFPPVLPLYFVCRRRVARDGWSTLSEAWWL